MNLKKEINEKALNELFMDNIIKGNVDESLAKVVADMFHKKLWVNINLRTNLNSGLTITIGHFSAK